MFIHVHANSSHKLHNTVFAVIQVLKQGIDIAQISSLTHYFNSHV